MKTERAAAALATALIAMSVVAGSAWRAATTFTITIPLLESVPTAQIYLFDNGYEQTRSFMTHPTAVLTRTGRLSELQFEAGDRFRVDLIGSGIVRFGDTITAERIGLLHKQTRTYSFDLARVPVHDLTTVNGRSYFDSQADPYVDVPLAQLPVISEVTTRSWAFPSIFLAAIAAPLLVYRWYAMLRRHYLLVLAFAAWFCFVAMLGVVFPPNHGPDEGHHIASGDWYTSHLLPPSMTDPAVYYDSYFGVNYIIGYADLTYLATFKTASVLEAVLPLPLHERARLAQLALFGAVFFAVLCYVGARAAATLLLAAAVVPQVSYLLTYVNGDALSYCLGIAALLTVSFRNLTRVMAALAFFFLANIKLQYAIILLPAAAILLYRNPRFRYVRWAALGGLVAGLYRYAFNVFDELQTHLTFKANQIQHAGPVMRDRLVHGYWDPAVVIRPHFYTTSLKSMYAYFGQMDFPFQPWLYAAAAVLAVALLYRNGWRINVAIACAAAVNLAASLWYSATYAYQPQGRYLLPCIALAFAMFPAKGRMRNIAPFAVITIFCLMRFVEAVV